MFQAQLHELNISVVADPRCGILNSFRKEWQAVNDALIHSFIYYQKATIIRFSNPDILHYDYKSLAATN